MNKIYLAHYLPLKERLEFMEMQFKQLNLSNVIYETSEPTEEERNKLFFTPQDYRESDLSKVRQFPLTKSEMSLAYKHYKIFEQIAKQDDDNPYALIIEDDAIFHKRLIELLDQSLNELKVIGNWDMFFIGSGWSETSPNWTKEENKTVYRKNHPAARCTDSFIVTREAAQKLLSALIPMHGPIDWELDRKMKELNFNVYWRDPPIVKQGSQIGQYKETVRVEFKRN